MKNTFFSKAIPDHYFPNTGQHVSNMFFMFETRKRVWNISKHVSLKTLSQSWKNYSPAPQPIFHQTSSITFQTWKRVWNTKNTFQTWCSYTFVSPLVVPPKLSSMMLQLQLRACTSTCPQNNNMAAKPPSPGRTWQYHIAILLHFWHLATIS